MACVPHHKQPLCAWSEIRADCQGICELHEFVCRDACGGFRRSVFDEHRSMPASMLSPLEITVAGLDASDAV
jgi:hypothetical protein